MYKIISIEIMNMMSHVHTFYTFAQEKVTVVVGINEDDDSADSNGSGKSVLNEAIFFALTGDSFRKINQSEMINNDSNSCTVTLILSDSINTITIERTIHREKHKASSLIIKENNVVNNDLKSLPISESNKYILNTLKIKKEDLINYFIISTEKAKSFFLSSPGEKDDIIESLTNTSHIQAKIKKVEQDISSKDKEIKKIDDEINKLEGKKQAYKEQIAATNNSDKSTEFDQTISALQEEIGQIDIRIEQNQLSIESCSKQLKVVQQQLLDAKAKQKEVKLQIKTINELIRQNDLTLIELGKVEAGLITCPQCSHRFHIDNEIDIHNIPIVKEEISTELQQQHQEKDSKVKQLEEIDRQVEIENEAYEEIKKDKQDLELQIKGSEYQKKMIFERIKNFQLMKEDINKVDIQALQQLVDNTDAEIRDKNKQKTALVNNKVELLDIIILFERFHRYLLNQCLETIQNFTNFFLEKLQTPLRVKINGYKELSSGKIKEQIGVLVLKDGVAEQSFEKLSKGQKTRIIVAGILALQKIVNFTSTKGLDLLILDEITEPLDRKGMMKLMSALFNLNQTILIISHNNYDSSFENQITVRYSKGISTIE